MRRILIILATLAGLATQSFAQVPSVPSTPAEGAPSITIELIGVDLTGPGRIARLPFWVNNIGPDAYQWVTIGCEVFDKEGPLGFGTVAIPQFPGKTRMFKPMLLAVQYIEPVKRIECSIEARGFAKKPLATFSKK